MLISIAIFFEELITLKNTLHESAPAGTHYLAESPKAMRIMFLAQGHNKLRQYFKYCGIRLLQYGAYICIWPLIIE